MNHSETITKNFTSKSSATNFVHFLDCDEVLVRRNGNTWDVLYNVNKTTVDLEESEYSQIESDS